MSEILIGADQSSEGAFKRGTMLLIVGVGILAFLAMLVLGAYAPDLRSGRNGGSHALSNAATGFSGIVRLARATARNPEIIRQEYMWESEDLVVLTPEKAAIDMGEVLQTRAGKATLIVFPKWWTQGDPDRQGWVRVPGLLPDAEPQGVLAPDTRLDFRRAKTKGGLLVTRPNHASAEMRFPAPPVLQTVRGADLEPIVTDAQGNIVVARLGRGQLYLLADPDLINNHGMASAQRAEAALALLDFLNSTDAEGVLFDVTLNGLGTTRSPLKLAFDPPFLAVTLAIFAALLLAGIQALARFGMPLRPERAIAFGKAALVDNTAALVRKAGREAHLGRRYADTIRERIVALLRLPPNLGEADLDARLDALKAEQVFTQLAEGAAEARSRESVLAAAKALHQWQQEVRA